MRGFLGACRYFTTVAVVPRLFLVGFGVVVTVNTAASLVRAGSAADTLSPLLTLQMFAAASGFDLPARRGHYDLLLTSAVTRWQVALAHGVVSALPGLLAWTVAEVVLVWQGLSGSGTSGTAIAFLSVSATAWATAVPTSRAKASVAWVVLMTGPPLVRPLLPTAFVGRPLVHPDASGVALAAALWLALGVTTASLAVRHIVRSGFPLEAAQ